MSTPTSHRPFSMAALTAGAGTATFLMTVTVFTGPGTLTMVTGPRTLTVVTGPGTVTVTVGVAATASTLGLPDAPAIPTTPPTKNAETVATVMVFLFMMTPSDRRSLQPSGLHDE